MLAGGKSSRMGRDKALLPFRGGALAGHVAATVAAAAGSVALIGDPQKYGHLGYPVLPDRRPGVGPLGGIESALCYTAADWNLVLACDMPGISAEFLRGLLDAAERAGRRRPGAGRPWRTPGTALRRLPPPLPRDAGPRARRRAYEKSQPRWPVCEVARLPVDRCRFFENLNTPEEWARYDDR